MRAQTLPYPGLQAHRGTSLYAQLSLVSKPSVKLNNFLCNPKHWSRGSVQHANNLAESIVAPQCAV